MLSKHDRPGDGTGPARKRLRANLMELVASGTVSTERIAETFGQIDEVGVEGFDDVALQDRSSGNRNTSRDLRKRLLRNSRWPAAYKCQVPFWDENSLASAWEICTCCCPTRWWLT